MFFVIVPCGLLERRRGYRSDQLKIIRPDEDGCRETNNGVIRDKLENSEKKGEIKNWQMNIIYGD